MKKYFETYIKMINESDNNVEHDFNILVSAEYIVKERYEQAYNFFDENPQFQKRYGISLDAPISMNKNNPDTHTIKVVLAFFEAIRDEIV